MRGVAFPQADHLEAEPYASACQRWRSASSRWTDLHGLTWLLQLHCIGGELTVRSVSVAGSIVGLRLVWTRPLLPDSPEEPDDIRPWPLPSGRLLRPAAPSPHEAGRSLPAPNSLPSPYRRDTCPSPADSDEGDDSCTRPLPQRPIRPAALPPHRWCCRCGGRRRGEPAVPARGAGHPE